MDLISLQKRFVSVLVTAERCSSLDVDVKHNRERVTSLGLCLRDGFKHYVKLTPTSLSYLKSCIFSPGKVRGKKVLPSIDFSSDAKY